MLVSILGVPLSASADEAPMAAQEAAETGPVGVLDIRDFRSGGWFVAGAVTGFLAHEGGHIFANLVYGNVPRLEGLWAFGLSPARYFRPGAASLGSRAHVGRSLPCLSV